MEKARQLLRLPGDLGNWILDAVVVIGGAATALAVLLQAWARLPIAIKALGVFGLIALIVLLVRTRRAWWPWLRRLLTPSDQGGGISQTFLRNEGRIQGLTVTDSLMTIGQVGPMVAPVPPIESSPGLLRERAAQLYAIGDRLDAFLDERDSHRSGIEVFSNQDWHARIRALESSRQYDHQTWTLYRRDYSAEVAHAYEQARSRGFGDAEMERMITIPTKMQNGHSSVLPTIVQRLKVIALQMEQRAGDMESGNTTRLYGA